MWSCEFCPHCSPIFATYQKRAFLRDSICIFVKKSFFDRENRRAQIWVDHSPPGLRVIKKKA